MPSNLHIPDSGKPRGRGVLYVIATPIGNRDDISLRALRILASVDLIAAEDTRVTGRFLKIHGLRGNLVSYHEHNEDARTPALLAKLEAGQSVALVSDAGTPSVSDPGYRLIKNAVVRGFQIVPIPGVSAATAALSVSGLPTDAYLFTGFLPRKRGKRLRLLRDMATLQPTLIFYESPRRIVELIEDVVAELGDRAGMLAREMTKQHEEFLRGPLSEIGRSLRQRPEVKGECTLLVAGVGGQDDRLPQPALAALTKGLRRADLSFSTLVKHIARTYNIPKNRVYTTALAIQQSGESDDDINKES